MIRSHWGFSVLSKAYPARKVFRPELIEVRGGHASTFRRLIRFGPFGIYVVRYRPGTAEESAK